MSVPLPHDLSYQRALRAIGAYLDQEHPSRFTVIEVPEGFTVVLQHGAERSQLREAHFAHDAINHRFQQLTRSRKILGSRYHSAGDLWPTGHQDFLRALGYELDDSNARTVVLDELEDGLLVTYSYLDPSQGFQWRKHMIALEKEQMQTIIQSAHARRHRRGLLRR